MKEPAQRGFLVLSITVLVQIAVSQPKAGNELDSLLEVAAASLKGSDSVGGGEAFKGFLESLTVAARRSGAVKIAREVEAMRPGQHVPATSFRLASKIIRTYTVARYRENIVADLRTMIGFRTHAVQGRKNWELPEFLRQREWLENRARDLGFGFKSYDGRVEEIRFQVADSVLALLTHGDVQPVDGQQWSVSPWDGVLVDGKFIGRGVEDDKGPIVVCLNVMKGLKDTGWRLNKSIHLLIANGEESDWSDIPYYQARAKLPDLTLGVDAGYPVTYAQKGFGIGTFRVGQGIGSGQRRGWTVESIKGGSGLSIIPSRGEAALRANGRWGFKDLQADADKWMKEHPQASLEIRPDGDGRCLVIAHGKGGHSSVPAQGHNALGDLTAFLATVDITMNGTGALVSFLGRYIGTETNGESLGIARKDSILGELTHNLAAFRQDSTGLYAESSFRIPTGFLDGEIAGCLREKAGHFRELNGVNIVTTFQQATKPHIAEEALVARLLSVWEDVMGVPGKPLAIGGGTQARLFPNGVDFGPGFPGQIYRGHAPDEYLTTDELLRITDLTTAAVFELTMIRGK